MPKRDDEQTVLEFRGVSVGFGEGDVLKDISFELKAGEMICITGDSASGKSV